MGFGNFAKMAQQMQADMARVEAELVDLRVEGSAGGGAVKAVVTGKQDLVSVTIDPGVVDPDDVGRLLMDAHSHENYHLGFRCCKTIR